MFITVQVSLKQLFNIVNYFVSRWWSKTQVDFETSCNTISINGNNFLILIYGLENIDWLIAFSFVLSNASLNSNFLFICPANVQIVFSFELACGVKSVSHRMSKETFGELRYLDIIKLSNQFNKNREKIQFYFCYGVGKIIKYFAIWLGEL